MHYPHHENIDDEEEEALIENQPTGEGGQPNPNPTPEQVLQQLQTKLQQAQQERDRLATTFAANRKERSSYPRRQLRYDNNWSSFKQKYKVCSQVTITYNHETYLLQHI
jgi:hypothetical protein